MSERSRQLLDALRQRLAHARRRATAADLLFGAVVLAGALAALVGLGAAAEAVLWMGSAARWAFVVAFWAVVLVVLGGFVVRPLLRAAGVLPGLDDAALARRIGARYPEVADRLTNLLDLASGRSGAAPGPLLDGAVQMLGRQVEPVPFERIEDLRPVRRVAPAAALPVGGVLLALLVAPSAFTEATGRLFAPGEAFAPPAPFALVVEPGDVEIARGAELAITVRAQGTGLPRFVTLHLGREGEERVEPIRLVRDSAGVFRHTEGNVRQGLRYRAEAEGVASRWYAARVTARPVVRSMQLTLRPPAYTGLPVQRLAPGVGDVAALPGTTVEVAVSVEGVRADSAALLFDAGGAVPLAVRGDEARGAFTVRREDGYRVALRSADGHANADPIQYAVRTLTDAPPQIRLLEPGDGTLTESLTTRVTARVTDDFGFSRAVLAFRLAERDGQPAEGAIQTIPLPIEPRTLDQDVSTAWLLGASGLGLRPGDAVAFYVEVWDNNAVAGFQSARTPTYLLRFPSLRQQLDRLDEAEDAARDGLDGLRQDAEEARRRFDDLRRELLRKQEADWEDRRQMDRLMQQQERLDEQVRQSVDEMQQVLDQMQENEVVTEETRRRYEELQRVIDEIADPELLEQLRKLQEAMQELNMEQMMQAMDRFEFDERSFRERIERALELFERLRAGKELDEAARRAEDLARQEERLAEETGALQEQSESGELSAEQQQAEQDRLAEQQRQAEEAAEALRQQLEELQQRMQEMGAAQQQQSLQQMQQQMQDAQQQMQQNQEQLQDGQLQDAQQGQQSLQQQMQQMMQQLQMMGEQMSGQQQQRNVSGLRRVLQDVLTLSFDQEGLRDRSAAQRPDSPVIRQNAQRQVELASGLSTVADTLSALSREIPEMQRAVQERAGEALREMGQATERLADREPPRAAGHQAGAMTSLNDLAVLLSDLLDEMQSGGSGGGQGMPMQQMMQQLQQMSGDQQRLNQEIQQMLNDMQGQRLSQDQQGRLDQLRQQQEGLRQQLEEMIRSGGLDGQTRSELQRIAEEMEAVARRLEGGRLDRDVREQQEHILTRLLEARESMNQRGRKEEREGTPPGQRREPPPPADAPPRQEIDRLRRDLIRALDAGYAPDYQELIKRYFDLLQHRAAPTP